MMIIRESPLEIYCAKGQGGGHSYDIWRTWLCIIAKFKVWYWSQFGKALPTACLIFYPIYPVSHLRQSGLFVGCDRFQSLQDCQRYQKRLEHCWDVLFSGYSATLGPLSCLAMFELSIFCVLAITSFILNYSIGLMSDRHKVNKAAEY